MKTIPKFIKRLLHHAADRLGGDARSLPWYLHQYGVVEATGLTWLEVTGREGDRRAWRFPTRAAAGDLFTRLEESGIIVAGGG